MDTRTGEIFTPEDRKRMAELITKGDKEAKERAKHLKEMKLEPTKMQLNRFPPRVGRNEPCPCGSGKKFKRCCLSGKVR